MIHIKILGGYVWINQEYYKYYKDISILYSWGTHRNFESIEELKETFKEPCNKIYKVFATEKGFIAGYGYIVELNSDGTYEFQGVGKPIIYEG